MIESFHEFDVPVPGAVIHGSRGGDGPPLLPLHGLQLPDGPYALGPNATEVLAELGVDLASQPSRRPLLRFCVDWSELRHHLSGQLGAAIAEASACAEPAGWSRF